MSYLSETECEEFEKDKKKLILEDSFHSIRYKDTQELSIDCARAIGNTIIQSIRSFYT